MPELIICDTSCLILFDKIERLELLRNCYSTIYVTPEIADEFGKALPDWVKIKGASNEALQQTLTQILGRGEASAIALTFDLPGTLVALDDLKAIKSRQITSLENYWQPGNFSQSQATGIYSKALACSKSSTAD